MVDFVHSIADFPFAIVDDGKSDDFVHYMIKKAVSYLESLAESYIIVDMQQLQQQIQMKSAPSAKGDQDSAGYSPERRQVQKPKQMISMTIADLEDEDGNYEFTVEEEKGNLNLKK